MFMVVGRSTIILWIILRETTKKVAEIMEVKKVSFELRYLTSSLRVREMFVYKSTHDV